ncbi:MAG: hypothetical protein PHY64_07145 [Eubacteriales bacterium]|nr:hypothetical protein [Eubacteriales bacterium]
MTKRRHYSQWLAAALMLLLSYVIFYALVQRPASDISIHAAWASEGDFLHLRSFAHHAAHPLWHMLVAALMLTGLPLNVCAALITAVLKAVEVWLLIELTARLLGKSGWVTTACGLALGLVAAIVVPWVNPAVYVGAGSPNTWHSPTQVAAMVMMLLCVPMTAQSVEDFHRRLPTEGEKAVIPWKNAVMLSALLAVSLLAKPTFMQAFLPAACLYFLVMWLRRPKNSRYIFQMMLVALPSLLVMALQYLYYFVVSSELQEGMTLLISWQKAGDTAVRVLLTRAFPLFVLFAFANRETLRKPLYQLTLVMDIVSIAEYLLLSETGYRASDGNFGWAMMGSALMLWAVTMPLFIHRVETWFERRRASRSGKPYLEDHPRAEAARIGIGAGLLLWHLAAGIYYIIYLLTTTNNL